METPPLIYTVEVYGANTTDGFFFLKIMVLVRSICQFHQ